jgi:hypothetical protein
MTRNRSFGGGGLWLRKKKRVSKDSSSTERVGQQKLQNHQRPLKKIRPSIQWDDVLERPVRQPSSVSSCADTTTATGASEDHSSLSGSSPAPASPELTRPVKKTRIFGSNRPIVVSVSALGTTPVEDVKRIAVHGVDDVVPGVGSDLQLTEIQGALDKTAVNKHKTRRASFLRRPLNVQKPSKEKLLLPVVSAGHPTTADATTDYQSDFLELDVCAQESLKVHQPNASTSLIVARNYFEQLDSNHKLVVEQNSANGTQELTQPTHRVLGIRDPVI